MKTPMAPMIISLVLFPCFAPKAFAQEKQSHEQCQKDIAAIMKRLQKVEQELERVKLSIKLKATPKTEPTPWILRHKVVAHKPKAPIKITPKKQLKEKAKKSVNTALQWLKNNQQKDGSWKGNKPSQSLIVTSNAVIVFVNSGHTHRYGDQRAILAKSLKHLLASQNTDGWFQHSSTNSTLDLLSHCETTNAVGHLFAATRDFKLKKVVRNARDALLRAELAGGGWSSSGAGKADAFVTAQVLKTFKLLSLAGIKRPSETTSKALDILRNYTNKKSGQIGQFSTEDNGAIAPKGSENYAAKPLTTSTATLCKVYYTDNIQNPSVAKSLELLSSQTPLWSKESIDLLHWHSTTKTLTHMKTMKKYGAVWCSTLFDVLVRAQNKDGTWPDIGPWGQHYGQAWATAMATRTLQFSTWE